MQKQVDSFSSCSWSAETSVQSGHEVPELLAPTRQPVAGSEEGNKEVEIIGWSGPGEGTRGTRGRGEIQYVLAFIAAYC